MTATATHLAIANESPVVLRASGLRKSFGGQIVLDGVDVELRRGEVVLLEGENGSGKTTLLNILTGNLEADTGTIRYSANSHATEFHFPRSLLQKFSLVNRFSPDTVARQGFGRTWQDVRLFDSLSLRDNIALGHQDQRGENPLFALLGFRNRFVAGKSLADSIEDAPKKLRLAPSRSGDSANPSATELSGNSDHSTATHTPNGSRPDATNSPDGMLAQLGLSGREHSSGDMISLGQSKRVAIARAIAAGAKVLFLDEPLAGLDRNGIDEVLGMLSKLVADHELTIVIIEHVFNQTYLHDLVTTRWQLADGQITVDSPRKQSFDQALELPDWFQQLTEAADEVIAELLPRGAKLTRFRIKDRYKCKPVLAIKDLVVRRGNRTVIGLDNNGQEIGFNLTIQEGEIAVLQAPNGWGKSTLVSAISGVQSSQMGSIAVSGQQLQSSQAWERKSKGICVLNADSFLFDTLLVEEYHRIVGSAVPHVSEPWALSRKIGGLSGGQRRRLALEHLPRDRVCCLDEPMQGLDSSEALMKFFSLHGDEDCAVLILIPTTSH